MRAQTTLADSSTGRSSARSAPAVREYELASSSGNVIDGGGHTSRSAQGGWITGASQGDDGPALYDNQLETSATIDFGLEGMRLPASPGMRNPVPRTTKQALAGGAMLGRGASADSGFGVPSSKEGKKLSPSTDSSSNTSGDPRRPATVFEDSESLPSGGSGRRKNGPGGTEDPYVVPTFLPNVVVDYLNDYSTLSSNTSQEPQDAGETESDGDLLSPRTSSFQQATRDRSEPGGKGAAPSGQQYLDPASVAASSSSVVPSMAFVTRRERRAPGSKVSVNLYDEFAEPVDVHVDGDLQGTSASLQHGGRDGYLDVDAEEADVPLYELAQGSTDTTNGAHGVSGSRGRLAADSFAVDVGDDGLVVNPTRPAASQSPVAETSFNALA